MEMKVKNVYLVDVIKGGSDLNVPKKNNFAIRARLELEGDEEFIKDMIAQINKGEVRVVNFLSNPLGSNIFIDVGLIFNLPPK